MAEFDFLNTTITGMKTSVTNYQVSAKTLDEAGPQDETYWTNPLWTTYLGYLKTIPEYRNAVRSLAIWTCGKGWTADSSTTTMLKLISGWGEDTFDSILQDMIIVKKTNGDAYSEIIRDGPIIINLKKLNPSRVRHVINPKGLLIGYDITQADGTYKRFKVEDIFHICNDRIANETHGTSVLESCKWVIDAKNEAMSDWRRILHRSSIRIMYVDADNTTRLSQIKTEYESAIKNGELMLIPAKKGEAEFEELTAPPVQAYLEWIQYLDNYFYEVLGVPKIITGGTQNYTEASSKIGAWTFEIPSDAESRQLEEDIQAQLGIEVKFDRPPSMMDNLQSDQSRNTGQMGFQPNDVMMGVGK